MLKAAFSRFCEVILLTKGWRANSNGVDHGDEDKGVEELPSKDLAVGGGRAWGEATGAAVAHGDACTGHEASLGERTGRGSVGALSGLCGIVLLWVVLNYVGRIGLGRLKSCTFFWSYKEVAHLW